MGQDSRSITIIYKSGAKVHLEFISLEVEWDKTDNRVSAIHWVVPEGAARKPIMAGIHNIEAIYEGHV